MRLVEKLDIEVLLPMTDTSVPLLLGLETLPSTIRLPFPPLETYREVSDKRRLMDRARDIGVPVPQQVVVEAPPGDADLSRFASGVSVVLKPARSAVVTDGGILRFGVKMVDRVEDASSVLAQLPPEAYPVMVQERITGPGLGAFLLTDRGRVLAAFGHRRLREKPPTGGVSVYREAVPLRDDVRDYAERVLRAFDWTGVAMVEFKEDLATGTPYLMEINGRFWGSLQLAVDAGVDFPALLVDLCLGRPVEPVETIRTGIRSRWLWGDVDHLLWMLLRGREARRTDPMLPTPLGALGRFLVPWRPGERYEVLRASDPGPFLRESAQWLTQVLKR